MISLNNKLTILVAGGAGFIGLNFIEFIRKERPLVDIICLDSLTYASNYYYLNKLLKKDNQIRFIKADITDRRKISNVFKKYSPDVLINFAAESHVDNSITNPDIFIKTNVLGTQVLMDACVKYGIKHFHQVSTDEVYGDVPLKSSRSFTEKSDLKPSSPYAASKASADLLVLSYIRTFGLPATISRCSNNFGPYQHKEKLIPKMISKALDNNELPIYGSGKNMRDWIYVEDHCRGILNIIEKSTSGQIYNLGAGCYKTNNQLCKLILDALKKDYSLITHVNDRLGHDLKYSINCSKAHNELDWAPKCEFDAYLNSTINWYIKNHSKFK